VIITASYLVLFDRPLRAPIRGFSRSSPSFRHEPRRRGAPGAGLRDRVAALDVRALRHVLVSSACISLASTAASSLPALLLRVVSSGLGESVG
jgi:hypothetical protein